jgi:hypothetical protein
VGGHPLWGDIGGDGDLLRAGRNLQKAGAVSPTPAPGLAPAPHARPGPARPRTSSGNSSPTSDRISDVFPTWAARAGRAGGQVGHRGQGAQPAAPRPPTRGSGAYPRPAKGCARPASWPPSVATDPPYRSPLLQPLHPAWLSAPRPASHFRSPALHLPALPAPAGAASPASREGQSGRVERRRHHMDAPDTASGTCTNPAT